MLQFALTPTPTPNASRWNIGDVGSPTRGAGVGHVDFMLFVSFLVALGTQRKRDIQWKTGFRLLSFQTVILDNLLTRFRIFYLMQSAKLYDEMVKHTKRTHAVEHWETSEIIIRSDHK